MCSGNIGKKITCKHMRDMSTTRVGPCKRDHSALVSLPVANSEKRRQQPHNNGVVVTYLFSERQLQH